MMENLYMKSTPFTPEVDFSKNGHLTLSGRSLPENALKFFEPLLEWVQNYSGDSIVCDIKLEYYNTTTSRLLFELLEYLVDMLEREELKTCEINWHYETGDEDHFEAGKYFEELLDHPFRFIVHDEAEHFYTKPCYAEQNS
jgi:hypothetical protein